MSESKPSVALAGTGDRYLVVWQSYKYGSAKIHCRFVKGPKISVKPDELDFGKVWLGQVKTKTLDIKNVGTSPLTMSIFGPDRMGSFRWQVVSKRELKPGERFSHQVRFLPLQRGYFSQVLVIESNTPQPIYHIQLRGEGAGGIIE